MKIGFAITFFRCVVCETNEDFTVELTGELIGVQPTSCFWGTVSTRLDGGLAAGTGHCRHRGLLQHGSRPLAFAPSVRVRAERRPLLLLRPLVAAALALPALDIVVLFAREFLDLCNLQQEGPKWEPDAA